MDQGAVDLLAVLDTQYSDFRSAHCHSGLYLTCIRAVPAGRVQTLPSFGRNLRNSTIVSDDDDAALVICRESSCEISGGLRVR